MQTRSEQAAEDHDHHTLNVARMFQNFEHLGTQKTNIEFQESYHTAEDEDEEEEEREDEEEFSFTYDATKSPISPEDAFFNGKIKPMLPIFNQDLVLEKQYIDESLHAIKPNIKKVLVEMNKYSSKNDEISGPYCEWKKPNTAEEKAAVAETCKKSNSTGVSKLWRLKDNLVNRSHTDGRDAFVFLNNNNKTSSFNHQERNEEKKMVVVDGASGKDKEKVVIKGGKSKTTSFSAHEIYLKNKAKENGRRKSYLPYRPEVFGFLTNVNGGLTKNVHPY
ncbi:hypothetical protein LIER_09410 [Lithospermum erythrorhizon]|uniref:Uncharacterized protein n=1 Tax=Lithospermum erythrorhizon TaxID=34254 RepID=A0AAV3PH76_LITER